MYQTKNGRELIEAVHKNDVKRVRALLASGVDIDARWDHGGSALTQAIFDHNHAMVDFLLKRNAPVNTFDFWGGTPLSYAAVNNQLPIVRTLLVYGADVNASGGMKSTTALIDVAGYGYTDIAELLIKRGAKINTQARPNGMTALMYAVYHRHYNCVKLLMENGADPTLQERDGDSALTFAKQSGDASLYRLLLR